MTVPTPRDAARDQALQRRARELMDAGLALLPALLQAQRELPSSFMITVTWLPDGVRLAQHDQPERSIDIPSSEIRRSSCYVVGATQYGSDCGCPLVAGANSYARGHSRLVSFGLTTTREQ